MRRHYRHDFWWGFGFPPFTWAPFGLAEGKQGRPFGFHFWGPWRGRAWGFGFPRREECLGML